MEDIVLVNAYKDGDDSSFNEIYERYIDDIYRYVYRKVGDREVSEDITSSIWMKILQNIEKYQEQSWATFKSWIYRIAHNAVVDHYRTRKEHEDIDGICEPGFSQDFWKQVDDTDSLKKVMQYLQQLWAKEKEIVILRVWDDMSYKEISEIVWESIDNCKQICSRSLKKIQANITLVLVLILMIL